jgi:integrase
MKLTKSVVDHLAPPTTGQTFYRDDLLKGFGLRITAGGAKSFVIEKRINGKVRRITLGRYGALTVEQARKEAQKLLGKVACGVDPLAERRDAEARAVTLGEVFGAYLAVRTALKPNTVHDYRRVMREAFPDWRDRPLAALTKEAVAKRHSELGARSPARANNAMRVLRALYNFASEQYEDAQGRSLFPDNPVQRLSRTKAWHRVDRRRRVVKRTELPAWFAAVRHLKDDAAPHADTVADYLLLLLFTGLRRSEAMGLRWENVDFAERTLTIPDTKNREPHTLPLSAYLVELLTARAEQADSPYVFPGKGPKGISPNPARRSARSWNVAVWSSRRTTYAGPSALSPTA